MFLTAVVVFLVSEVEVNFERYGNAQSDQLPTVVLHGWANSLETVKPFATQLANYSLVYSLDLPGHGKSSPPEQIWGMEDFSLVLKEFLAKHELSKVNLVGHSFGGKTAIKFTASYPQFVGKLVLIGASGLRPKPSLKKRLRALFLRWLRLLIRFKNTKIGNQIYRQWYIPRFASRDYLNAGPMTATFVKTVNQELSVELAKIDHQSLLIWGDLDDESPLDVARQMEQLLKNSRLIVIPHQGHYPFLGSSAPLVVKFIRDFLWGNNG